MNSFGKFQAAHQRRMQKGYSMVELTVVLVVISLIGAAVFFGLQSNARRVEVGDNGSQVLEIMAELKKKFGRNNQYGMMTTALAVQSRAIPEQLRVTPTTAQNSYGGPITVAAATCVTPNDCATITWPGVPQAQCMDFVIGTQAGARTVNVGGTIVKPLDLALNMATLATQCEAAATAPVVFTISR